MYITRNNQIPRTFMFHNIKMSTFVFLLSLLNTLYANKYLPAEGDTLNYTQVIFQWEQVYNAHAYQLQIAINDTGGGADPFTSSLSVDLIDTTLLVIVTDSLDWGQAYVWRIRSLDSEDNASDWSTLHYFHIAALPSTIPSMEATMHDENKYVPGLYVLDVGGTGYTVAFDHKGKPVHLLSTDDPAAFSRFRAFNWLPNGNILGAMSFGSPEHGAWEMTLDGDVVWSMKDDSGYELHNEFLKLPNGNYMGMARRLEDGPIPDGPWKAALNDSGFTTFPYLGDDIVEFNKDGTLVWSVNMFDLYNTADYDSATWYRAQSRGYYDWIHFNAIFYDEVEDMIYLSARHLSRITKLDHQTKLIVWNMGRNEFPNGISSDVTVGTDLGFSMQHAIEVLENGNLILYNNDNLTGQQTQALEIEVTQTGPTDPNPTVQIVWEYTLPDSLYTQSQGDADRLPDGNTLIAIANPTDNDRGGRLWEVDPQGNIVWRLVLGDRKTMFAAEKVPGLYAQAFSVIIPEFAQYPTTPTIFLPVGEATLEFDLHNEGWLNETYDYSVLDSERWFSSAADSISVAADSMETLTISGNVTFVSYPDDLELIITPRNAPDRAITISVQIWSIYSQADEGSSELPRTFALRRAYPNPFNPSTTVRFELPIAATVSMSIYNILGQQVQNPVNQYYPAGYHSFTWKANSHPSGLYFIRMDAGDFVQTRKVMLLK